MVVVVTITIGLAVGAVAAATATTALQGSTRDENSKDALAAAEAGAQVALLRQNQVAVSDAHPCVAASAGMLVAGALGEGNWCPGFNGTVGDASYSYRVSPPQVTNLLSQVEIVSTGTANGVTRRIHTIAEATRANAVFAESTVLSDDDVVLDSNSEIYGNVSANGDLQIGSQADVCGAAEYGGALIPSTYTGDDCPPDREFNGGPGSVDLPPVDQGNIANDNDNWRIDPNNPLAPDTISGNRADVEWNAAARTLRISSNSKLTLGGTKGYSFCRLVLESNSWLIVAAGAQVRIFFDRPENCQPQLGTGPQILLSSNSRLTTTDGNPASLQLLVVGSDDPAVTSDDVQLNSNSNTTMPLILYAPNSAIEMNSNSTILGGVAGESVHLDSNAGLVSHPSASNLEIPLPLKYRQTQFVECTSTDAPATAPSSDC